MRMRAMAHGGIARSLPLLLDALVGQTETKEEKSRTVSLCMVVTKMSLLNRVACLKHENPNCVALM